MMKNVRAICGAIVLTVVSVNGAGAADYAPGSVILLPKSNSGAKTLEQKIDEAKGRDKQDTKVQEKKLPDNVSAVPGGSKTVVVGADKDSAKDKESEKLSNAYAAHLVTSICTEQRRDETGPRTVRISQDVWNAIQSQCKCQASEIMKQASAEDVVDYVMYNYGWQDRDKKSKELSDYYKSPRNIYVSNLSLDPKIRTKCGFPK